MSRPITGQTRVAGIIGHPVVHSLSPALHRAGFASLDADWTYVAFPVAPGAAHHALDGMRALGISGLSVTMPHKHDAALAVDRLDPASVALGSINTVSVDPDGALAGASTDGAGLVAALTADGVDVSGRRVGVLGAGGAARSIVDALARAGASHIVIANRTPAGATSAALLAPAVAVTGSVDDVAACDLLVNTTPVGMGGDPSLPLPASLIRPDHVVVDIVTYPLRTPLLVAAEQQGARTVDGLGMLVHQAALQEFIWLGEMPDVTAMRDAALRELAERGQ